MNINAVNYTVNGIHEKALKNCLRRSKNLSFDELLTMNYFFNVIYLYLLALLDFSIIFTFFLALP